MSEQPTSYHDKTGSDFSPEFSDAFNNDHGVVVADRISPTSRRKANADFRLHMKTKAESDRFEREERRQKEIAKSKTPEARSRRKAYADAFEKRTVEILSKKNKLWKNLVETYLAGGEQGLEEELFDPRREGKVLTREILEKDKTLQKQLAVMFVADRAQRTLQDFIMAMPTEEDYVANAMKRMRDVGDANVDQKVGLSDRGVLAELDDVARNYQPNTSYQEPVSGEIHNNDTLVSGLPEDAVDFRYVPTVKQGAKEIGEYLIRQDEKEKRTTQLGKDKEEFLSDFDNKEPVNEATVRDLAEQSQKAYVDAYRAYDAKATKDKSDDLVAMLKPPFFALSRAARELKQLYASMTERNQVLVVSDQIGKNLAASDLVKPKVSGISAELQKAAADANELGLENNWFANSKQVQVNTEVDRLTEKKVFQLPSSEQITVAATKVKPGFTSPLVENFQRAKTVKEGIKQIGDQRVEGIKRRIQEIESYFADKNPEAKTKDVRQYLLGSEIKGWFKGEQKRLQQEYKDLYNNDLYQKYLQK